MREWYSVEPNTIFSELETGPEGLSEHEAARRLVVDGPNALPEGKRRSTISIFFSQFQSPLIYVLLAAAALVLVLGEIGDGLIIMSVLIFNAVVGTVQEGRAEETLRALRSFVATTGTVMRDGVERTVSDRAVVEGDVIVLSQGEKVPADARLISAHGLRVDESSLTGESTPVAKDSAVLEGTLASSEQLNMVFRGTLIVAGSARAVVVRTGTRTLIGGIAAEIVSIDTEVPLVREVRRLSHYILVAVAVLTTSLFSYGVAVGYGALEMFTTVVSLAVSMIPEGLPIVLTLVLATGVWRMSKRNALVKRLQAVEALGQASVIAVDKTGTITKNELVVRAIVFPDARYRVTGVGYEPAGSIEPARWGADDERLTALAETAALVADARVTYDEREKRYQVSGDPTDAALVVLATKLGVTRAALTEGRAPVHEIPFDFTTKFHASVHLRGDTHLLVLAGAPESVFARAHLTQDVRRALEVQVSEMSEQGLRVIALAQKVIPAGHIDPDKLTGLTLVGLVAMQDALRVEVAAAVAEARGAGIRVVMITGDHKTTAQALARDAGIFREGDEVLTGDEIDAMSDRELVRRLDRVSVFARVTPAHKLEIIQAYKSRGDVVAMTGDGVNDAPPLVAADLGVAMGGVGTEVAKEAADIVILDDNFSTILSAVEEGRSIYQTVKKVILYLFSTSVGEALTITAALVLVMPLPLLASQIIWLNFVTDGFLTVALAMEPKERNLMRGRATAAAHQLIDSAMRIRMLGMACTMAVGTLFVFWWYLDDRAVALTMSLTTLAVFQWFNAWNCRSDTESVCTYHWRSNPWLVYLTGLVIALQVSAVYIPALQHVLHTMPLTLVDWGVAVLVGSSIVLVEEVRKYTIRRKVSRAPGTRV